MTRTVAGRYELDALPAGRGGMGEVWFGRDLRLHRDVAVKFVRFPDDDQRDELVRRFVRESRITARLEHPGVPAVYDVGTDGATPYLVMQRVHGVEIADVVAEQGPLPIGWAAAIGAQACAVLAAAHRESLVHRDLKPGNLMLGPDGTLRVLDFGLAVALASGDSQITRSGEALGTPAYMAPELVMAGRTDPRTDLYALGCTLHEMLTGGRPFRGETAYAVMHQQVDARVPDVRSLRPEVPAELAGLVRGLLAKSPDDRPGSAGEVFGALLPYVRDLAALPGVVTSGTEAEPARMQATVLARVLTGAPVPATRPDPPPVPTPGDMIARSEIRRARDEAESLAGRSRISGATEVLAAVEASAVHAFGAADPEVVSLRRRLADLLFDAGDFRRAGRVYGDLVGAPAGTAERDEHRRWRRQEATCRALTGDTAAALTRLRALVDEEQADRGSVDDRVLDLRKQVGLLLLGHGAAEEAADAFTELLADVERAVGDGHPEASRIRELQRAAADAARTN